MSASGERAEGQRTLPHPETGCVCIQQTALEVLGERDSHGSPRTAVEKTRPVPPGSMVLRLPAPPCPVPTDSFGLTPFAQRPAS